MTWLFFSFASLILTVTNGLVAKLSLNNKKSNLDPVAFASATFTLIGVTTFVIYIATNPSVTDLQSLFNLKLFLLLGVNLIFYTISPSLYFPSLKNLPLSVVTIVYSLSGFFAYIIGSILKVNTITLIGTIGSILIITSVVLVSFNSLDLKASRYLPLVFLATLIYSLAANIDQQLLSHFSTIFYMSVTFGIPGLLLPIINRTSWKKIKQPYIRGNYLSVFLYSLFISTSFYTIFLAYKFGGSAAKVYSVLAIEAVATVIASAIFLNERKNLFLKIIAAIIAGLGIYLLL